MQRCLAIGTVIRSATLSLTTANLSGGGAGDRELIFSLHGYAADGQLAAADFGVSHEIAGPFTASTDNIVVKVGGSPNAIQPDLNNLDVTAFVQALYGSDADFAGLVLRSDSLPDPELFLYQTFFDVSQPGDKIPAGYAPPTLTIEFDAPGEVPEPGSLLLFTVGVVGLAGGARLCRRSRVCSGGNAAQAIG